MKTTSSCTCVGLHCPLVSDSVFLCSTLESGLRLFLALNKLLNFFDIFLQNSTIFSHNLQEFTLEKKFVLNYPQSIISLTNSLTLRSTLTRYGSRNASSMSSGSGVYRNRCILIIARTVNIANWNFFLALNWLWRRIYIFT